MVTLKQTLYVRERNPDANVYIIYEDMVTPGTYEYFYRRVQEEPRVFFTKGEVAGVAEDRDGDLVIDLEHALIGERVQLKVDIVVLATGMVPAAATSPTLNLQYRQGSELPGTGHGFADSNYICFPYETRRTALYAAGCARQPMDVADSMEDASGAALKAIQSLELVSAGMATHPRAGDLSFPKIRVQACTQCRRCLEECPFSVIEADERGYPHVNEDRCRRCGICMGACPVQVISFDNYSVDQLSSVIKAFSVPEEEGKFRVLVLACENDAYPAFDMAGINRLSYDASVRVVPVRCIGSVNMVLVRDALNGGVDGILLMGCKSGDDYQCHFITGSGLAEQRMENVRETVQRMMMEPERVRSVQLEISEYDKIPALLQQFVEELTVMGPNPFKGF
ncbi:MAG TPA: hydrogenase iron-sulfur subunit [Dehalococcoidia bacterium]|nr:hydrogenase iron-sulfur subunit [Dehalococcoidia bacterium]